VLALNVRKEEPRDHARVFEIQEAAFGSPAEAQLVRRLRANAAPLVSLVAEIVDGTVVGHVLFSPVEVVGPDGRGAAMALGPVGVDPAYQREGVGDALCRAGLAACLALGELVVFVLGHPAYYPRFGFEPARPHGLFYKNESFDPAFFVTALSPGALEGFAGEVVYRPEFDEL